MAAMLPTLVPMLRRDKELAITDDQADLLMSMSPATIDRKLADEREKMLPRGRSHTKPGSLLKSRRYALGRRRAFAGLAYPGLQRSSRDPEILSCLSVGKIAPGLVQGDRVDLELISVGVLWHRGFTRFLQPSMGWFQRVHHSGATPVLRGRIRAPKDKASVENTVGHIATWVTAGLRDQQFPTLQELTAAIEKRISAHNAEPFQKRPGSRLSVFTTDEEPLLTPLPQVAYEISQWAYGRRVARNGHVSWARNYYSVPFEHIGAKVDLRITDRSLEAYSGLQRATTHLLLPDTAVNEYRTNDADLPAGERYQPWDAARVREWAERIGASTLVVINRIFESVPIDEQGLNPALAVLRLARRYSADRIEAACRIVLAGPVRSPRYAHVHPILVTGQDQDTPARTDPVKHGGYVRGASYYAGGTR